MMNFSKVLRYFLTAGMLVLLNGSNLTAQNYPENVDLKISLETELPQEIKINGVFAVEARVSLDVNSSSIPGGETVRARIELLDPDGITIDSYQQTWDGFSPNTNGSLQNGFL